MNPYPTYKHSGIDWLGEIPAHWEVKRVKDVTTSITGFAFNSSKYSDSGIKLVRGINVKESVLNWNDTYYWPNITPDLKRFALKSEDVLIQMDGSKVGKNFCIVQNDDLPLLLVQRVTRLRVSKKYNSKYLFYIIAGSQFFDWISIKKTDPMVPHITLKDIEEFNLFQLPFPEQTAIVNYLDSKTATIDRKIELLTSKANKYKALRRSLINETVCRGLNPDAPLKDSGVEWIGMIPEHWEIKRVKEIFRTIGSGTTPPSAEESYYEDSGINWLQTGDLNDGFITETSKKISQKAKNEFSTLKFYPECSLVIAMYGATIGKMGYLNIKTTTNQACCVLTKLILSDKMYVFYQLLSMKQYIISLSTGGGQPNINQDIVRFLKLAVPPLSEQTAIASYLDEKTTQIDAIVSNIEQQINKLTQLRKSLINDVVTGKIKVTEA